QYSTWVKVEMPLYQGGGLTARRNAASHAVDAAQSTIQRTRLEVIVVNKWDGLSQEVKEQVKETLDFRLGFIDFARVHFISALHG
ncbi:hypothetical protein MJL79_28870, partial [Salmonella enterica subsp. enterica serovar Montevideo]|nr:hypothetical protein [Salmonella enterica subsp. enterica serovar Montevideo]